MKKNLFILIIAQFIVWPFLIRNVCSDIREAKIGTVTVVEVRNDYSLMDCKKDFVQPERESHFAFCQSSAYSIKKDEAWVEKVGDLPKIDFHKTTHFTLDELIFTADLVCSEGKVIFAITTFLSVSRSVVNRVANRSSEKAVEKAISWEKVEGLAKNLFTQLTQAGGCKSLLYRSKEG